MVTATEIAHIVVEAMGLSDVRFAYTGGCRGWPGDVPVVIYDVDKMKELGWRAKYTSAEAVRIAARRLVDSGN
jgi:UDP-glucose 4-epimerase